MRSPHALVITLLAAGLALTGCTGSSASDESSGTTAPTADASPVATATPVPADGPVDTVAACGALTEPLQQRMIAEYAATTGTEVGDCATLIRQSSALYAAAGLPADVTVEVESESADDALLQVTYANGDCGTVHLVRTTASWALTELSEECAG